MSTKRLLFTFVITLVLFNTLVAQQPFGGCWHPDYIQDWTPEKDPDSKFNRSTVPLEPRFVDTSIKANANQYPEGQVAACLTMNPMCSQTPSQGADNFIGYNPTYWQYMDLLIWWGGSAGEGIIIPPSAPVTDIAHLHGVKVLGQLFFPPKAFGGQEKWVKQMLTYENGTFPYAEKMYEIAKYYGFDGWFINEETGGGTPALWTEWVDCFNKLAAEDGNTHMEIQWYDMATTFNRYSDMMKLHNTSFFLNYGSPSASNIENQMNAIQELGFTEDEAFRKLYFGIEVAQGGMNGNASYYKNLFPVEGHKGSIDLFNPEEPIWKRVVGDYLGTPNASGEVAYGLMNTVFDNEARYWTNEQHDPSDITAREGTSFPGLANAIIERSAIQTLPFVTSFSAGLGKHRFVNGEKKGTQDWYHRGMQNVLPTWRWWIDVPEQHKKDVEFSLNWDDAYNFGTSIRVNGNLTADVDYITRLYKTRILVSQGDKFELAVKNMDVSKIQLKLGIAENANNFETFGLSSSTTSNGWTIAIVDLSSLAGKTISTIALNFRSTQNETIDALIGQLAVLPADYSPAPMQVGNLHHMGNALTQNGGDIRVIWDAPVSEDISHYNVYMTRNEVRSLVGQTRNEGFYISKFERTSPSEINVKVEVAAVTKNMIEGSATSIIVDYPKLQEPVVTIKTLKSLGKTGDEIRIVASATNFPETFTWTIPQGAEQVKAEADTLVLKFNNEGIYDISVAVSNQIGTTIKKAEKLIEISNTKTDALEIVSVGKKIHSFSGSLPPEDPENIIDGVEVPGDVKKKWCIGGSKEHWVVIDLQNKYQLYRFRIFDCGHKENYSDNFKNFKIWVSNDAENWTLVVDEKNRPENTKDDYIAPQVARYVKFMPYDDDSPITIRIWEFQVYGIAGGPIFAVPESQSVSVGDIEKKTIIYDLNGDDHEPNFDFKVISSDAEVIELTDIVLNKEEQKLDFTLSAKKMGAATITLTITNGEWETTKTFKVDVDDPSLSNVLLGKVADASYLRSNGVWNPSQETVITDGDTATGWSFVSYASGENCILIVDCGKFYDFGKFALNFETLSMPGQVKIYVGDENNNLSYALAASFVPDVKDPVIYTPLITGRFVKLVINASAYTSFLLNEFEGYGSESSYLPPETEITLLTIKEGFNVDVIAENKPSANYTSNAMDDQGWVFFSSDVQEDGAITTDGGLTSTSGIGYNLGVLDENNALSLKSVDTGELVFTEEPKAMMLYLLATSANGTSNVAVTINYKDSTREEATTITLGDWFGGSTTNTAMTGLGRIIRNDDSNYKADDIDNRLQFRLFESVIPVNKDKEITSISLSKTGSGYPVIFAVSKKSEITPDNIENLFLNPTHIYPNPVANGEVVTVESENIELLQLVTMQGDILKQKTVNSEITQLSVDGVPAGAYLLILKGSNETKIAKLIIR